VLAAEVKLRQDRDKQWDLHLSTVQDTLEEAYRMNADFNKRVDEDERQLRLDRDKQLDIHLQRTREYYEEAYDLNAKFDKASHEALRRQAIDHQHLHPILRQTIRTSDRLTESIARVFGKGSRSEFLNVFGRSVGALSSLLVLPLKAFSGLLSIGGKVSDMFEGGFSKGIVKLTASFGLLAVGAAGLTVLLGGVFVAVGVLTSALLSLAGAAVAVASSLTFALAGGAVVALGALVPLAAGIGVATLAIMNMDEETKKAFDGIGKSFKALGTDAAGNIFNSAAKDAEALEEAVKGLSVITGPVSKALGGLLDEFIDSLSDPALVNFQAFLGRTLPGMVTSLGHIVGNFGEIFMGIWIAITPFVQRFLDWFSQVTQEFANWVNSAEGKNTIRQFLEDAFDSAESLGGALEEIIGLIGDLFGVSRETGDSIFDTLAGKVEEWRAALNRAKEDGVIQQWFRDAKETTDEIGRMVEAIGKFADAMDTPENRETVRQLTGLFDDLLLIIETLAPVFVSAFHSMGIAIEPVATAIRQTKAAFKDFGGTVRTIYNSMIGPAFSQILKAIGGVLGKMGDLFGALASVKGAPDWIGKTADALHGAEDQTNQLADAIRTIPDADIKVTGPSDATINKIEAQLAGLSRPRTATITVNTLLTGHPGPGAGGQDDRGVTAVTTPTTSNPGGKPTTGQGGNSRTVNANGWQIVTPTKDPEAVAAEVLNRLAGAGY
jgi:phage-related protein